MAAFMYYYVDENGNQYIDENGNYYVQRAIFIDSPEKNNYIRYKPYFYNSSGAFKGYTAFIRQADGSYLKLKPYIYTKIEIAVAGLATAGYSRVGDNVIEDSETEVVFSQLLSSDNYILKDNNNVYLTAL